LSAALDPAQLAPAERLSQDRKEVDLIRRALQEHLKRLQALDLEERDRLGYEAQPQRDVDFRVWEDAAAWPED